MRSRKRKIRKSIRTFYIVFAIIIIAFCSASIFKKTTNKDEYNKNEIILSYTNKLDTKYSVDMKDNPFIKEELPMGQTYVTDLIDGIKMNFNYTYDASKYTKLNYSYSIIGVLTATYSKDGTPQKVWEKETVLLEAIENRTSENIVKIDESINIDIEKYNDEINAFEETLGMAVDAKLNVQLRININGNIENTILNNKYISNIDVELGEKTTQINGNLDEEKSDVLYRTVKNKSNSNGLVIALNIMLIVVAVAWLRYITTKTINMNTVRNNYKLELNRILKSCEDKIVKLSKNIDLTGKEIIEVNDFGELIKISEELYKPILYWNSNQKEEAEFFVITNNVIYRYILKLK